jgi:hypothetical protein
MASPNLVNYNYGFAGPVGANPSPRQDLPTPTATASGGGAATLEVAGVLEFADNRSYSLTIGDQLVQGTPGAEAAIQGRDGFRPYVRVASGQPADPDAAAILIPETGAARTFRIEGLWLGSADATSGLIVARAPASTATLDWEEITIRETTLDPGGERADGVAIPPLNLLIEGRVRTLRIERAIVGAITVFTDPTDCSQSGLIEELIISDSIVDGSHSGGVALDCPTGQVTLSGVTLIGDLKAVLVQASNSIVLGQVDVLNQEQSCFRFTATSKPAPGASLPRMFHPPRSAPTATNPAGAIIDVKTVFFTSLRFGDPGYAALSLAAPVEIVTGAENGSELGSFSFLRRPIALRSVQTKVDEFKPAGVIAQYIFEGEHPPAGLPPEAP